MMSTNDERATEIAELQRLLETWGGTPVRWPEHVAARVDQLSALLPAAGDMIAEARGLDRVLDRAPLPSATSQRALADRIVAAALSANPGGLPIPLVAGGRPATAPSAGQIIALGTRPAAPVAGAATRPRVRPGDLGRSWQAATVLAACLMAGVYLGGSLNLHPLVLDLADAFGIAVEFDAAAAALGDDIIDEEPL